MKCYHEFLSKFSLSQNVRNRDKTDEISVNDGKSDSVVKTCERDQLSQTYRSDMKTKDRHVVDAEDILLATVVHVV